MKNINEITRSIDNFRINLEKQWRETGKDFTTEEKLSFLNSNIELLEVFIGLIESFAEKSNSIDSSIDLIGGTQIWSQLRNIVERMQRRIILLQPPSSEELRSTLMWMSAKGEQEELALLKKVQEDPLCNSEDIDNLLKIAIEKIESRLQIKSIQEPEPTNGAFMTDNRDRVVRFNAPVLESWKQRIEAIGAKILQPLGRSEFVVSIPNEDVATQIGNFEEVAQVTPYVPTIRVQPQLLQNLGQPATKEAIAAARLNAARNIPTSQPRYMTLPGILTAVFFTQEDRDRAAIDLESQGIRIADRPGKNKLIIDLSKDTNANESLVTITEKVGLKSLEEKIIPKLFNNEARKVIGKGVVPSNPTPTLGLTGKGEIIAIADSGIDTGEIETLHLDFLNRVDFIQSYPIRPSLAALVSNPGGDDGASDTESGHGTHVAGSALGSGEQAQKLGLSSIPVGMAPEARLVFQAIEQTPKWNREGHIFWWDNYGENPPKLGLFGIPDDIGELFQDAYDRGARIHSNSWGGGAAGVYDDRCEDLDRFVRENPDFLVIVAAGNDGKHSFSGIRGIDPGSITSPGTAKNCLTVGASENKRSGQFADTYGNWWPNKFPYLPFKSDNMAASIDRIAAFSSRGPCQSGYRKPDVIAPGTFILSTRSSQIPNNNFGWGAFPPAKQHYMYMGGTSMATPLVAGCAALVRQFLREKYQPLMTNPSAALVKAILIHSAQYIKYRYAHPASTPYADNEQGWGRVDLQKVLKPAASTKVIFIDEANGLTTGENREYKVKITKSTVPLKVTLVYTDFPGENLVNNLNLTVHSPSGKSYLGNDFQETGNSDNVNNVEGVVVKSPETGDWKIEIIADDIQMQQQDYAVVISGGGASLIS